MTRHIALFFIRLYQQHLSPRKGFSCAHAAVHGGPSCSAAVAQIIASDGVWRGRRPIEQRFVACRSAAQTIYRQPLKYSRGALDCDCGFSSCGEVSDIGACSGGADTAGGSTSQRRCSVADLVLLPFEEMRLRTLMYIILMVLAIVGMVYAYHYGSAIESVTVTRTSVAPDGELGLVDRVLSGRELRYFIVLEKRNGRHVDTDLMSGDFSQGIRFEPVDDIRVGQIDTLILKRKQALLSETLVSVAAGDDSPFVDGYTIVVHTRWPLFQREYQ